MNRATDTLAEWGLYWHRTAYSYPEHAAACAWNQTMLALQILAEEEAARVLAFEIRGSNRRVGAIGAFEPFAVTVYAPDLASARVAAISARYAAGFEHVLCEYVRHLREAEIAMSNQDTRRYVLRAETASGDHIGYWTGKAGDAWVCADGNEAYECGFDECLHKIALFNKRSTLTGIIFQGDEVVQ